MLYRFFSPKDIIGVGTFQDAGPLENDPLVSALSEVAAIFPLVEEPDFIVSLGTGTPSSTQTMIQQSTVSNTPSMSVSGPLSVWKYKAFPRLCRMLWEKMRDRNVKHIFRTYPRYHRLDIKFDDVEPRLDDTKSIPELKSRVQKDQSLSKVIDNIARCAIASLFYFEIDSIPERCNGEYVGTGFILCCLRRNDPALELLLDQLSKISATFYLNDCPILGAVSDSSFISKDGNFRKRVELNFKGKFTISLKQGDSEPCNISGSPFSTDKLVSAQGLSAHFGRADHRKRKTLAGNNLVAIKRQRI